MGIKHKQIYGAMKRTSLKEWMVTVVIILFYFNIGIQGMEEKKNEDLENATPRYLIIEDVEVLTSNLEDQRYFITSDNKEELTNNRQDQSDLEKEMASDLEKAIADSLGIFTSDVRVTLKDTDDGLSIHYSIVGDYIMHYQTEFQAKEFKSALEIYMHQYESLEPIVKKSSSYELTKRIYKQYGYYTLKEKIDTLNRIISESNEINAAEIKLKEDAISHNETLAKELKEKNVAEIKLKENIQNNKKLLKAKNEEHDALQRIISELKGKNAAEIKLKEYNQNLFEAKKKENDTLIKDHTKAISDLKEKHDQTVTTNQADIAAKDDIIQKHTDLLGEKENLLKDKNFSILIYQCALGGIGGILLILSVVFGFCCRCKRNDKPPEISSNSSHKENIEIATDGTKEPKRAKEKKEKKVEEVTEERHGIDELLETSEEEDDYVSPAQAIEQQENEREEKERRMLTFKENMKKQMAFAKKIKKKQKKMEKKRKAKESSILRDKKR